MNSPYANWGYPMKRLLTLTVGLSLAFLMVACGEQPLDPNVTAAEGGIPGPPPGKGPPPGTPIPPGAGPPGLFTYAVGVGNNFSCALQLGLVFCWGDNEFGRLGDGTNNPSAVPVPVVGDRRYTALAVGDNHACALDGSGVAYCWGGDDRGQLGDGTVTPRNEPVVGGGGIQFKSIDAGLFNTCGIAVNGTTYCWGLGTQGQLGDGSIGTNSSVPVAVATSLVFESVSNGWGKTCGIATDGLTYCWGRDRGDFGNGTASGTIFPTPVLAANGLSLSSIHSGALYTCGLDAGGAALCWGRGFVGELGNGAPDPVTTTLPAPVVGGLTFASLDVNNNNSILGHTCGVTPSGDAYCWGSNSTGQLGGPSSDTCEFVDVQFDCSGTPVLVQGGITFTEVVSGTGSDSPPGPPFTFPEHTCGLAEAGAVYCWGGNDFGQLGDGTFSDSATPVLVDLP